jgi:hypothetical protein
LFFNCCIAKKRFKTLQQEYLLAKIGAESTSHKAENGLGKDPKTAPLKVVNLSRHLSPFTTFKGAVLGSFPSPFSAL